MVVLLLLSVLTGTLHAQPGDGDTTRQRRAPGQFEGRDTNKLNAHYRLVQRIRDDSLALAHYLDSLDNTPMAIMQRNLTFSSRDWAPSAAEQAKREELVRRLTGADKVLLNIPRVGISIPLKSIGQALGLTEDVSPRIKYTLLRTERVAVKVYNIKAQLVAVVAEGVQSPGDYKFDWDMLDSAGVRVPYGDYFAEVVAEVKDERRLLLRKRIEVP